MVIDKGGPTTRGVKPKYGEVKKVKKIQGADVIDESNKVYSTKFTLPVTETTEDAGPVRIEQPGSDLVDRTRRERLQQYANELARFLRGNGGTATTAVASKHLRQNVLFQVAMRNLPSFGAFVRLFDEFELITDEAGGSSVVKLKDMPPRRRARTKRPDPRLQ